MSQIGNYRAVELEQVTVNPVIRDVQARYAEVYGPAKGLGIYSKFDWRRISHVFDMLPRGASVLDVGFGAGQLLNALALSGQFDSVAGLDIAIHSKFLRLADDYEIHLESIDRTSLGDDRFDCVICMEVLEHIDREMFLRSLSHLRRICRRQLIMSVPYDEPLPLPRYHKQKFTDQDVEEFFPDARKHLLQRPTVPWLLLEERLVRGDVG